MLINNKRMRERSEIKGKSCLRFLLVAPQWKGMNDDVSIKMEMS